MGISDADTAKNLRYLRFVCKKTAHFANVRQRKHARTLDRLKPVLQNFARQARPYPTKPSDLSDASDLSNAP